MTPYVDDPDFTLYVGDALETLTTLPDGCVDCVVTSPPYWGLRDYGTGVWDGGDPDCDHLRQSSASRGSSGLEGATETQGGTYAWGAVCGKCGATRTDRQLGLEATPDEYVARMVELFREVRRVLADHGSVWLNLGDSYASTAPGTVVDPAAMTGKHVNEGAYRRAQTPAGLKPKDLVGIPWRVAFALQQDGWYLRSDIVWSKPNPMPESVTDRPTKAHEYVFLLSKGPRYFFDQEAVREGQSRQVKGAFRVGGAYTNGRSFDNSADVAATDSRTLDESVGRNARSVWEIATRPFSEAHFATYPPELVRRCLLAGCPEGGTVLDPFLGSGTTALVAREHGRRCVGIELNEAYAAMAARRLGQLSLLAGRDRRLTQR